MKPGDIVEIEDASALIEALPAEISHDERKGIAEAIGDAKFKINSEVQGDMAELIFVDSDDVEAFGEIFTTIKVPMSALKLASYGQGQESTEPSVAPKQLGDIPQAEGMWEAGIQKQIQELITNINAIGKPKDPEEVEQVKEMRAKLEQLLAESSQALRLKIISKVVHSHFRVTAQDIVTDAGLDWEFGSETPNSFIKFTAWPKGSPDGEHSELHLDFKGGSKLPVATDYSKGAEPAGTAVQQSVAHEDWSFSPNADLSLVATGPGGNRKMTPEEASDLYAKLNMDPKFKTALSDAVSRWDMASTI